MTNTIRAGLAALMAIGAIAVQPLPAIAASCSSEDGSSSCSCKAGERCVRTQSQCWCEAAKHGNEPPFILAKAAPEDDSCPFTSKSVTDGQAEASAD